MSTSRVRVGVRIRPLLGNEKGNNNNNNNSNNNSNNNIYVMDVRDNASLQLKGQTFTYDHVFNSNLSQTELYTQTASPMLKSFLEGYNVTIIAYGQTGSGKTYTMGTSDLQADSKDQGLIPRFLTDLFDNISNSSLESGERLEASVSVSFLEIYGEDVFDLINLNSGNSNSSSKIVSSMDRPSLLVREDDKGHAIVQGLHEVEVKSAERALEQLDHGTRNRITGKTNMNAGSSRSHAVFTVLLKQSIRSGSSDDIHHMTSKLTFVDLAGSERIKRTGAEGQRMKEGIQINSGLFNLGQVINALADEQRLKQGTKSVHVPYRNSKLTHLLKDALGGNSQTLFLACVSPAEVNESETLSTLNYAKQARNIQNKPVQNMDFAEQEIRRLKTANRIWMLRCIHAIFVSSKSGGKEPYVEEDAVALLQEPEVRAFLSLVDMDIGSKVEMIRPSPRKIRLSLNPQRLTPVKSTLSSSASSKINSLSSYVDVRPSNLVDDMLGSLMESDEDTDEDDFSHAAILAANIDPEETERLVSRMIEMVSREKENMQSSDGRGGINVEEDGEGEDRDSIEEQQVDKAIEEKEEILQQLLTTVKGYSTLKTEYERLLETIGSLEKERKELETELEKAKNSSNSSSSINTSVESMKARYAAIAAELEAMRMERKKKESAYVKMQRESKQCEALRLELVKLKESKVALQRQQKSQVAILAKLKKDQQVKMSQLKKGDVKKQQQMNTLKSELTKKERILHHKQKEITRMASKLHACEEHITQLLKIQNRNRNRTLQSGTSNNNSSSNNNANSSSKLSQSELEHLQSARVMLDNLVLDRLDIQHTKQLSKQKIQLRQQLNIQVLAQANLLDNLRQRKAEMVTTTTIAETEDQSSMVSIDQEIMATEDMIDRISSEIEVLDTDLQELARHLDTATATTATTSSSLSSSSTSVATIPSPNSLEAWEEISRDIITSLSSAQVQQLSWDLLIEKVDIKEALQISVDELASKTKAYEQAIDRVNYLNKQLIGLKTDTAEKLAAAELKYKQDTWKLLKSSELNEKNLNSDLIREISSQKAIDLELQLEESRAIVLCLEKDLIESKISIVELQDKLLQSEVQGNISSFSLSSLSSSNSSSHFLQDMQTIWDKLGLDSSQRNKAMESLRLETSSLRDQLLKQQQQRMESLCQQSSRLEEDLMLFQQALGAHSESNSSILSSSEGLVTRCDRLKRQLSSHIEIFKERMVRVTNLKERLLDYMMEMWLDSSSIPNILQQLLRFPTYDDEDVTSYARAIVKAANKTGIEMSLQEEILSAWEVSVRDLNVQRLNASNEVRMLRDKLVEVSANLGIDIDSHLVLSIIKDMNSNVNTNMNSNTNTYSGRLGSDEDEVDAVLRVLKSTSTSTPGSNRLVEILESFLIAIEDMVSSRRLLLTYLDDIIDSVSTILELSSIVDPSSDQISSNHANGNNSRLNPTTGNLRTYLQHAQDLTARIKNSIINNRQRLISSLNEAESLSKSSSSSSPPLPPSSPSDAIRRVKDFESLISELSVSLDINCIDDKVNAIRTMSLSSVDNNLIGNTLEAILSSWNSYTKSLVHEAMSLLNEMKRVESIVSSLREVHKMDQQLQQQVLAMEEFESKSKQDRMKLLSGNSRALVEEEKFRKSSKRKYEVLTERLLSSATLLQSSLATKPMNINNTRAIGIDVIVEFTGLSSQAQLLLRGRNAAMKETTSLMHLHTMTHGTRHWTGEIIHGGEDNENTSTNKHNIQTKSASLTTFTSTSTSSTTHTTKHNTRAIP